MQTVDLSKLPEGWFDRIDIEWYREIYSDLVPMFGYAAEIGCHRGRSICSVADIILRKNIGVMCVDPWLPWEGDRSVDVEERFREAITTFELNDLVFVKRGTSCEVAAKQQDRYFDLVFIDADHQYESVRADIEAWESKVKLGGWLGGHDYGTFVGVTQAVQERYPHALTRMDSSIWLACLT